MQPYYKDVDYVVEGNIIGKVWQYILLAEAESPTSERFYEVELHRGSWNNCKVVDVLHEGDIANVLRVLRRARDVIRKHKDAEEQV